MIDYELLYIIGTWFGNIALALALLFVLSYAMFFKWWTRPAGRSIMAFVSVVVALSSLGWFSRMLGDSLVYDWLRVIIYGFAMVASGGLLLTLWSTWVKQPPDGLEPSNALTGEPTPKSLRLKKEGKEA